MTYSVSRNILLSLLFIFVFTLNVEAQCAMCRAVLESQDDGSAAKGINNGIMYLMVFPYLLVGGIGVAIYRNRKKGRAEKNNQEE